MQVETIDGKIGINFSTIRFNDDFAYSVTSVSFDHRATTNLSLTLTLDEALHLTSQLKDTTSELIKKLDKVV